MKKIIWLASWFPSDEQPFSGDFIERHAKAVSLFQPVVLFHAVRIHAQKTKKGLYKKKYTSYPQLYAEILQYRIAPLAGFDLLVSYCYSIIKNIEFVQKFIKEHGKPDCIHVHVTLRCGIAALLIKWMYHVPFIVSEHFGGYLPGAGKYTGEISYLHRLSAGFILRRAMMVTTVSHELGKSMQQQFGFSEYRVIPNVVDMKIFKPAGAKTGSTKKTFLHISTLTPEKNTTQILGAFAKIKQSGLHDFVLNIVGPGDAALAALAGQLQLTKYIHLLQETDQPGIAELMQQADALILYSHFESFGCVNIESVASGTPVIVSDLPVFREYLLPGKNALFVPPGSEDALAEKIISFIQKEQPFDTVELSQSVQQFSFVVIGKQLCTLYNSVVR